MPAKTVRLVAVLAAATLLLIAQNVPSGIGKGWMGEFDHACSQLNALAEATPAAKFSWRPAEGVRSISEVYMHIAMGNYFLLGQAGVKLPPTGLKPDAERTIKDKAEVLRILKDSQERVRNAYPPPDPRKAVKFFGGDTTVDGIFLRILVHSHEHMGQSIAYARMNGIAPPWSRKE